MDSQCISDVQYHELQSVDSQETCLKTVHVSTAARAQVTHTNVEQVYRDAMMTLDNDPDLQNAQADQPTDSGDQLFVLFRGLPRDMFINQLVSDCSSCETTLDHMRTNLYSDFPYGENCEPKRRVHTRSGDSVAIKLAKDIHVIVSVLEGNDYSDLKDIINMNRNKSQRTQSASSSVVRSEHCATCSVAIKQLQQSVANLQGDFVTMKQAYNDAESERTTEFKGMNETLSLVSQKTKDLVELVTSVMDRVELQFDRLETETRDNNIKLKNDIKTVRSQVKECADSFEIGMKKFAQQMKEQVKQVATKVRATGKQGERSPGHDSTPFVSPPTCSTNIQTDNADCEGSTTPTTVIHVSNNIQEDRARTTATQMVVQASELARRSLTDVITTDAVRDNCTREANVHGPEVASRSFSDVVTAAKSLTTRPSTRQGTQDVQNDNKTQRLNIPVRVTNGISSTNSGNDVTTNSVHNPNKQYPNNGDMYDDKTDDNVDD